MSIHVYAHMNSVVRSRMPLLRVVVVSVFTVSRFAFYGFAVLAICASIGRTGASIGASTGRFGIVYDDIAYYIIVCYIVLHSIILYRVILY